MPYAVNLFNTACPRCGDFTSIRKFHFAHGDAYTVALHRYSATQGETN